MGDLTRAWPFESSGEPEEPFRFPADFVRRQGPDVAAVVVRIGLHDAQLVLVDQEGRWERWVFTSVQEAESAAGELGVSVHSGSYPEELRVRMNAYARPASELARAPYGEQGRVGPVISYPENRRPPAPPPPEEEPDVDVALHRGLA